MHWGGHAWAAYGLVAIGLGYFAYNKKLPFAPRSLFYPLIKEKIYGILGDIIDTVAVLSVLFGLATSLGLGAQQINSGLSYLTGLPFDPIVQIVLIITITTFATLSVVSGLNQRNQNIKRSKHGCQRTTSLRNTTYRTNRLYTVYILVWYGFIFTRLF
jgi:choline-glycine betaine transporter